MQVNEYLDWADSRGLSSEEQARVLRRLNEEGKSIEDVDQEDLDELAEDVGIFARALGGIIEFFSSLF